MANKMYKVVTQMAMLKLHFTKWSLGEKNLFLYILIDKKYLVYLGLEAWKWASVNQV